MNMNANESADIKHKGDPYVDAPKGVSEMSEDDEI
jgi:hypothetical protein